MQTNSKKVLEVVEKVARIRVEQNVYKFPPICRGFLHQPKRPKKICGNN